MPSVGAAVSRAALRGGLRLLYARRAHALVEAARRPREEQESLLRRILAANAETAFGREHGFARVDGPDAYREAVPVQDYEQLRPLIERQELTGERLLTAEQPVYYNRTSGTVGAPKNIPVTRSGIRRMKHGQQMSAYVWSRDAGALDGKVFAIGGAAVEGHMEGGAPYGSATGLLYRSQSRFVRSRSVLAPELADVDDYETRYVATAARGFAEPNVTGIGTANPSTLLRVLAVADAHADEILRAVETGRLSGADALPPGALRGLRADPRRASQLRERFAAAGRFTYAGVWPNLRAIVTWTGGSCGVALGALSGLLPEGVRIIEAGYVASEFRGTLNVDGLRNACLPTLRESYFEFAERASWEAGGGAFLGLHELEDGGEYYVFATTQDGLYRYDINDIVRVNGRVHETPTLEFVQKGKGVVNITGEKLTEAQALAAAPAALAERGAHLRFFIVVADEEAARYTLLAEPEDRAALSADAVAADVDARLCALNVEYDAKRKSGRLGPLAVRWLRPGAGDAYRERCVADGQRDAQFKHLHVQYARECKLDLDALADDA